MLSKLALFIALVVCGIGSIAFTASKAAPFHTTAIVKWQGIPSNEFPLTARFHYSGGTDDHTESSNGIYTYPDPNLGGFLGATVYGVYVPVGQTRTVTLAHGTEIVVSALQANSWGSYEPPTTSAIAQPN